MNYSKKVIDKYAVGRYCEIEYCTEYGWTGKKTGWIVPNDPAMFKSMSRYKYALLEPNDGFFAFNVKELKSVTLKSNGYTLPKTMKGIEK